MRVYAARNLCDNEGSSLASRASESRETTLSKLIQFRFLLPRARRDDTNRSEILAGTIFAFNRALYPR